MQLSGVCLSSSVLLQQWGGALTPYSAVPCLQPKDAAQPRLVYTKLHHDDMC